MKLELVAAAIIATALGMPAFAQDKPATEAPKADAPKANTPSKKHSHMEDRQGIKPSGETAKKKKPVDKKLHSHPRDR